jgi:hypothetical protein
MTRPSRSPRIRALLAQSAVTYLLLCAFFGIHQATSLLFLIAVLWGLIAASARWPFFGSLLISFLRGLLGSRRL